MSTDIDHADAEVRGLSRLLPTKLAKSLLFFAFALPTAAFQLFRGNPDWFWLSSFSSTEQTLIAFLVSLALSWVLLGFLVFELCDVIRYSKHRRIVHYSNEHPQMSFMWLKANAKASHYLAFLASIMVAFFVGFYLSPT